MNNLILQTDSYKTSHYLQDPPGTSAKFSYISARKLKPGYDFSVFFGLQAIINNYLGKPISRANIYEAEDILQSHGVPFNKGGWQRIQREHGGFMPVRIRALPEGTVAPNGVPLVTVETTDPMLPWVGSYLEDVLLRVWYPTTVATKSYQCKQVIREAMLRTCDTLDGLPFKLHDFGARGVSSGESAMMGGMGHLVNFMGTDTLEALVGASKHYHEQCAGFSIPASEHSTITAWGRDGEAAAYKNMLDQFAKPGAILAVVSDSYDIFNAVSELWGGTLREQVTQSGATLVIRPDSGHPQSLLPDLARRLDEKFGSTVNSKGFKVLNHVRLIQGDGIDSPESIRQILACLEIAGYSAENIAFGMGGGLLQQVNRDTLGFAMKCSAVRIDGAWHDVYKDPITDPGKTSLRGRVDTYWKGGKLTLGRYTDDQDSGWSDDMVSAMQTVYNNGDTGIGRQRFSDIRARAEKGLS
jgi:nicotinamide phosphoribosyltransferase